MTARTARAARHRRIPQAPKHARETVYRPPSAHEADALIWAQRMAGFPC